MTISRFYEYFALNGYNTERLCVCVCVIPLSIKGKPKNDLFISKEGAAALC